MKQPDRRLVELLPCSIAPPTMEQRDLPKTMEHASGNDCIKDSILKVVLENSHADFWSVLAGKIGELFTADACSIVSTNVDSGGVNQVGYWQQLNRSILPEKIIQQLSILSLDRSDRSLIERPSTLFDSIENLLRSNSLTCTWIGITTQFQHQTNGLVLLLKQSDPWTQAQSELLKQYSDLMAIAISQVQFKQQAHTKTRYQTLLKNLSREISRGYQPQLLFDRCLREVCTALQLNRGSILMLKYNNPLRAKGRGKHSVKGTATIVSQWTDRSGLTSQPKAFFSVADSQLCQTAWQNAPNCLYFASETAFPDLTTDLLAPYGSALLMMPLMGKKTSDNSAAMVLGFLVLQHDSPRHWSEDELDLLDWIRVQVSTAIINHQTLNQVQSIVDERTAQLKSSLDVQAKLSTKMRQHIEQLQKLNQLKDDFMNSMSHELKTPLTSMKMAIKMLRQAQISPEMREKYLDILEQEWHREYSLIKDLLTLQQVESGELNYSPQELDLTQTVANLTQKYATKWQTDKEVELITAISKPNLKIYTDADSLEHILNELLLNAGKYSDPNTKIELVVSSQDKGKERDIVISVANVGTGITPKELPYIFDKFRRGQGVTDRAVPGTGLGLTLVQYLVEHLNGTIEVTSEPLNSDSAAFLTTFVLKLPQIQPSVG